MRRLHRLHSDKNLSQLPLDINTKFIQNCFKTINEWGLKKNSGLNVLQQQDD